MSDTPNPPEAPEASPADERPTAVKTGAKTTAEGVSKGRLSWFRVLTVLFGVGAAVGLFGISLFLGWFEKDSGGIHRVHDIGSSGVLAGLLVAVPFLAQVRRPTRWVASMQQIFAVVLGV